MKLRNPLPASRPAALAAPWMILALSALAPAQTNYEQTKLLPPFSGSEFDYFASSAMSAGRVLSAAYGPLDGVGFPEPGGLRAVYVQDATTGQVLLQLQASDGIAQDGFGIGLAADGNTALIGAPYDDDLGYHSGSAYQFDLQTGQEVRKLHAPGGQDRDLFGRAIAIDGNFAVIGAPSDDRHGQGAGAAYVFDLTTGQPLYRLDAPDPTRDARFGTSLAIGGGMVVVARRPTWLVGPYPPGYAAFPKVYVYDLATGQFRFALLPAPGGPSRFFGADVAISGSKVLVGEYRLDTTISPPAPGGAVHVYDGATGQHLLQIDGPVVDEWDLFGSSLATDGGRVAIGAGTRLSFWLDGAAYVHDVSTGARITRLVASTSTTQPVWGGVDLGIDLGVRGYSGGRVLCSAILEASPTGPFGAAYVFDDSTVNSGDAYCFGDGSGASCPCGANGFLGEGCLSSAERGGFLIGAGDADVSNDLLRLLVYRLPAGTPLLLFQGDTQLSAPFAEGIRCTNALFRHTPQVAGPYGAAVYEHLGPHAAPGSTVNYQVWYRDPDSACGLGATNLTNGWSVTW